MKHEKKIATGILGATGSVGQKFIQLLTNHPYFELAELAASDKSAGKKYSQAVNWFLDTPVPEKVGNLTVKQCKPDLACRLVFSGLDSAVAGPVEQDFARAGYIVVSNSKNHRFDKDVPLLIPEVNADHLDLLNHQSYGKGKIVTNPNCSTIGLVLALKPLHDRFGLKQVNVTTMQALSGAGYPGVPGLNIIDNVIPFISGEEEKIEAEPLKILGTRNIREVNNAVINISASCNRVAVIDGHMESVQIVLKNKSDIKQIINCWTAYKAEPQHLKLPSAPLQPIHYMYDDYFPQPRLHRNIDKGMAVIIGRLRPCNIFDFKFNILSHNTIRGAAGGAILCAELMKARGYLD